jgi:transposase
MTRKSGARRRETSLYRFQVIAPLLPPQLSGAERAAKLAEILAHPPLPANGQPAEPLTKRTVYRWLRLYREGRARGDPLAALEPAPRRDRGRSRVVPPDLLAKVITIREKAPRLSARRILERIDHEAKEHVARRSVSRALREAGYDRQDKRRRIAERERGQGSDVEWYLYNWEADFPNEVWQIDSTPSIWLASGPERKKPVHLHLLHIIDDHSRLIVGGGFTERLRVVDLLRFLCQALRRYGCPGKIFLDQAKIHRSAIVVYGLARLGGEAVFGTKGHAPGHGKIERLHQEAAVLEEDLHLSPVTNVADACRYYDIWRERSALEVHGVTGEAPLSRWERILGNARIPGENELLWAFRGETEATIDSVGAIRCRGKIYEAPTTHREEGRRGRRRRVTIRFDLLDDTRIWIEDPDGLRHECPLYRVRSHTEHRPRRRRPQPGISFASLFSGDESERDAAPEDDAAVTDEGDPETP